ncbi:MAG: glycosyltransferase family 4 protein [Oscillospiraceae bacterium]|nr:glycosyltransferase family 4 protein [Oscillospiraceae bacterium]
MKNVLQIMNYGAQYKGNFISSMLLLEDALLDRCGENTVYLLPSRAKARDWANEMIGAGKTVYFMPGNPLKAASLIRKIIGGHDIDIIHSHFITFRDYIPLQLALLFKRIPHLFHAHSVPKKRSTAAGEFLKRRLTKLSIVVCVSDAVSEQYTARGYNCVTVRNGLDLTRLDAFQPIERGGLTAAGPGVKIVFMMGYDLHVKGVDTAVRALSEFDTSRQFALCVCVANHMDEVRAGIIELLGEIPPWVRLLPPRADVASYYRAADIFLAPSRFEGFSYSVCEAAYMELPLALSDIPAHRELSIPGAAFFAPEDAHGLYDALCGISRNSPPLSEAKSYAANTFSIEAWIKQILSIYNDT